MSNLTILAVDTCECAHVTTTGMLREWMGDIAIPCSSCGHVCRVIELDLGKDPAALLSRAANEKLGGFEHDMVGMEDMQLLQAAANALEPRGD